MPEPSPGLERVEAGRVAVGRLYAYHGLHGSGRLYRVLDVECRHAQHRDSRTGQYQALILYEGLDGGDRGTRWVCTAVDFCLRFKEVVAAPAPAPPEKVIDLTGLGGP